VLSFPLMIVVSENAEQISINMCSELIFLLVDILGHVTNLIDIMIIAIRKILENKNRYI
jgi:hypothetical protein